jgi:hypothetical protein
MSPEGTVYFIEKYLEDLRQQAHIAEAFFNGRIPDGIEGLMKLPQEIRLKIDQLIWESAGGKVIDPTDEASSELITAAILYSLEERMGLQEAW